MPTGEQLKKRGIETVIIDGNRFSLVRRCHMEKFMGLPSPFQGSNWVHMGLVSLLCCPYLNNLLCIFLASVTAFLSCGQQLAPLTSMMAKEQTKDPLSLQIFNPEAIQELVSTV